MGTLFHTCFVDLALGWMRHVIYFSPVSLGVDALFHKIVVPDLPWTGCVIRVTCWPQAGTPADTHTANGGAIKRGHQKVPGSRHIRPPVFSSLAHGVPETVRSPHPCAHPQACRDEGEDSFPIPDRHLEGRDSGRLMATDQLIGRGLRQEPQGDLPIHPSS